MGVFASVVTGVVSSLVATLLFLGTAFLIKMYVVPWVEDKLYRGVRIDGHWKDLEFATGELGDVFSSFDLAQKGDSVEGVYSHGQESEGVTTNYRVKGEVRNMYLNASFWPLSSRVVDSFTFLGRIYHGDGQLKIKGVITYVTPDTDGVKSAEVEFVHDSA